VGYVSSLEGKVCDFPTLKSKQGQGDTPASLDWRAVCESHSLCQNRKKLQWYINNLNNTYLTPPSNPLGFRPVFYTEYRNMRTCEVPFVRIANNTKKNYQTKGFGLALCFVFKDKMELKKKTPSQINLRSVHTVIQISSMQLKYPCNIPPKNIHKTPPQLFKLWCSAHHI